MADPVKKPLTWSKAYPSYAEKHEMYRVFQETLKELIVMKPLDPLAYIRDELPKIADQLHAPRIFLLGPNITTQGIGRQMALTTASKYLTLSDVIETAPLSIRGILAAYIEGQGEEGFDDSFRKLLVATIMQRVRCADCQKNGYILYGFPQNKAQALCAQQSGLLPRQVFILLPEHELSITTGPSKGSRPTESNTLLASSSIGPPASTQSPTTHTHTITPTSQLATEGSRVSKNAGGVVLIPSSQSSPSPAKESGRSYFKDKDGTVTKVSSHVDIPEGDYSKIHEIADSYDYEICTIIPYEKWSVTKKTDIQAELLANIVSIKPCGSPWIPRIIVIGPPSSGKSTMAEQLSAKYEFVNVDFIECVRGAALLQDDVGKACKKYLRDLYPMTDHVTRAVLQKRLLREDCERKGWILHGFPDTIRQLTILDQLEITPNRAFYLSCPEEVCWTRLMQKRQQVLERKLQGAEDKVLQWIDEMNFEEFPYGKNIFRMRMDGFGDNFDSISSHFGKNLIYVDASQKISTIFQFMDAAVLRPPVVRYREPE